MKKMTQRKDTEASNVVGVGRVGAQANVLFLIAKEVLRTLKVRSPQSQSQAMVSSVFAVAAVETFLFDLGEEAIRWGAANPSEETVREIGTLMRDMEESKFPISTKMAWIVRYLTGKPADRGSQLYQDFDLLVRLRNAIIHLKDSEEFFWLQNGSLQTRGTPKVIPQLEGRNLIARPYRPHWIVAISTRQIAEWSCQTAAQIVNSVIDMLPGGEFKEWIRGAHKAF